MSEVSLKFDGGDKLERALREIAERVGRADKLKVGFLDDADYPTGLKVAQVAFWNEFGTSRAPARPFFRNTISRYSPEWGGNLGKFLKSTKYNVTRSFEMIGTEIKDEIVESIARWPADNAESTVKKKGFNHGLVDSGLMQRSVDFRIDKV